MVEFFLENLVVAASGQVDNWPVAATTKFSKCVYKCFLRINRLIFLLCVIYKDYLQKF